MHRRWPRRAWSLVALRWMLTPDAPLYIKPRIDPELWRWLARFRRALQSARLAAQRAGASRSCSTIRARGWRRWVRDYGIECEFAEAGVDYVFRDRACLREETEGNVRAARVRVFRRGHRRPPLRSDGTGAQARCRRCLRFDGDAVLRPDRYVDELARLVRERGGEIVEQCAFESVDAVRDGVTLRTSHGTWQVTRGGLRAGGLVAAAGIGDRLPRVAAARCSRARVTRSRIRRHR
jgi:D-amino-acid dehydrogenase